MEIKGIEGLSYNEIHDEVAKGAKFVHFTYCFSIIVMTFRKPTDIYFIRANESSIKYGWPWLLISLFFGWWGIPWGPVYTLQAIFRSFSGKNITPEVLHDLESQHAAQNPIQNWDNFNGNPSS